MTKHIAAVLVACAAIAVPAFAATPDAFQGPKHGTCVDIDSGDGGLSGGAVNVAAKVLGVGCPTNSPLYRLDVYSDSTMVTLLASTNDATLLSEDESGTTIGLTVPVTATSVCIVMTTGGGQHEFDRAPDSGCIALSTTAGGALGGFH